MAVISWRERIRKMRSRNTPNDYLMRLLCALTNLHTKHTHTHTLTSKHTRNPPSPLRWPESVHSIHIYTRIDVRRVHHIVAPLLAACHLMFADCVDRFPGVYSLTTPSQKSRESAYARTTRLTPKLFITPASANRF